MKTGGFKCWTVRPRSVMVESQEALLQGHQLGHPNRGGSLWEAAGACHQTPPRNTRPSNLVERLRCKCRGAAWSLSFEPGLTPGQKLPSPWL